MHPLIARVVEHPQARLQRMLNGLDANPYFRALAPQAEGGPLVFGSNNYLGLKDHPEVVSALTRAASTYGCSTTGSRLLNGTTSLHLDLEQDLAELTGREAACVFSTGYQTNVGLLSSMMTRDDVAIVDRYAHASVRDGLRMSGCTVERFAHNNMADLERLLVQYEGRQPLVVVDGVYSMEGSIAPIQQIAALTKKFGALLMIDEAHSLGLYGRAGGGLTLAAEPELHGAEDIFVMASLSKALGGLGGFVAGTEEFVSSVKVVANSMIFATSSPPPIVAAVRASLHVCMSEEGNELRQRIRDVHRYAVDRLVTHGWCDDPGAHHFSPIIPLMVGQTENAIRLTNALWQHGIYVGAAIYPAVPKEQAILRVCLTAEHRTADVDRLVDVLGELERTPAQ